MAQMYAHLCAAPCCCRTEEGWQSGLCVPFASCDLHLLGDMCCCLVAAVHPYGVYMAAFIGEKKEGGCPGLTLIGKTGVCAVLTTGCVCTPLLNCGCLCAEAIRRWTPCGSSCPDRTPCTEWSHVTKQVRERRNGPGGECTDFVQTF